MSRPIHILLASVALVALSGCASSRSPLQGRVNTSVTGGNGATLATSAAIGAGAAAALAPGKNRAGAAAVGGAVGLITGALVGNHNSRQDAEAEAEAYERGRRDARVEVMQKYWKDQTLSPEDGADSDQKAAPRAVDYPAGTYEGIKYGPRTTTAPTLEEPRR